MSKLPWYRKSLRLIALFLVGVFLQFLLDAYLPSRSLAQTPSPTNSTCAEISAPLTPEEQEYARIAWKYFTNNYQSATGLVNSTGEYPSATVWDAGNYLMALNAARWLNLTDQADFDFRLNQFLTTLSSLKLFDGALPSKVYNTATKEMVDYANNPVEKGIGWSALDIGRLLAALHIIRTCQPQYADWIKGIVSSWQIERSLKDGQLYGATITADNEIQLVQEGRLGYEEYAVRGYELWGFKATKAVALEPFKFVEINGVQIPVDTRDYQSTNANNYVVSESYILDGIEFGLEGALEEYAARVLEVQKRRYESTGQLTAVTEDNIDQVPYFLYNTIYSNGVAWATITDENKPFPQFRSISTKAAFGWRYLYPDSAYAKTLFEAMKGLSAPDGGGFYAGLYEETKQPNKALTGNTNGLILEILFYKARGNRPLIGSSLVSFAASQGGSSSTPTETASSAPTETASSAPTETASSAPPETTTTTISVAPIASVGSPQPSSCPALASLNPVERRYASAAWTYFKSNYQETTGLVSDRPDVKAASLWGMGDYLAALHAARTLNVISAEEFDQRTRYLLGALGKLPLFAKELPGRGYDIQSLQPVDYGGNPTPEGIGFSALDVGRMLASLYTLKSCHPEYTAAVDEVALNWSYSKLVQDGLLFSSKNSTATPKARLGYEEYAARAFQLWGFDVSRAAVGGQYQTKSIQGIQVATQRRQGAVSGDDNPYTVSNPFLLYGLEWGLEPQMKSLTYPLVQAQAERYRRTGTFTASATAVIDQAPYIVHSTIIGQGEPWATFGADGKPAPDLRLVSTATAFGFWALFPENPYAQKLLQATTDLYDSSQGYYEGFYEKTGKAVTAFSSSTNSVILQSLLYRATNRQPLIRPTTTNSPWWQAVSKGNNSRGLPTTATPKIHLVSDTSGSYWTTNSSNNAAAPTAS